MLSKKQILVTAVAMIIGSFLINLLWILNKCYREAQTGIPLNMIFIYFFVVTAGLFVATRQSQKLTTSRSLTVFNCVATSNLCLSITGAVFMYFDNGSRITTRFLPLLIPFFIGILIFEKVFFSAKNQNRAS